MRYAVFGLFLALGVSQPAAAQDLGEGENLFLDYCATCHGRNATGDGPMAPAMSLQPTDLTQLQLRNAGTFPSMRVIKRVDGRDPLVSHGSPMPVFGEFFEGRGVAFTIDSGEKIMTSQPVIDLLVWLQSIQE